MDWKIFQWWASLTPTNKLITGLGIAIIAVSTALTVVYKNGIRDKDKVIDSLTKRIERKDAIIALKDSLILVCKDEANKQANEVVEYEREKARLADSMYYQITAARQAVKKAKQNARK